MRAALIASKSGDQNVFHSVQTTRQSATVDKLQLTLHASELKNVAGLGKGTSDPYAEVKLFVAGSDKEPGKLLGRTEVIKNSLSPEWTTSFIFDHSFGKEGSYTTINNNNQFGIR